MSISFSDEANEEIITTAASLPEDKNEGSLRPKTISEYIGQRKAKDNLYVFINAAKMRGESLDHVLLHGPPGLGKTTLAAVIANEMGVNMRITSGPAIEKPGDLVAMLTNLQEGDILFVDEIHRLNRAYEEILYPAWRTMPLISSSARVPRQILFISTCHILRLSARQRAPVSSPPRCATASVYRFALSFIRPRSFSR